MMAACRALMCFNFRISTSRIPYNMREAELGSHPVARKRRLSSDLILWFGPRRSPFSRPGRIDTNAGARSGTEGLSLTDASTMASSFVTG